jgi:hypothetical protein
VSETRLGVEGEAEKQAPLVSCPGERKKGRGGVVNSGKLGRDGPCSRGEKGVALGCLSWASGLLGCAGVPAGHVG